MRTRKESVQLSSIAGMSQQRFREHAIAVDCARESIYIILRKPAIGGEKLLVLKANKEYAASTSFLSTSSLSLSI